MLYSRYSRPGILSHVSLGGQSHTSESNVHSVVPTESGMPIPHKAVAPDNREEALALNHTFRCLVLLQERGMLTEHEFCLAAKRLFA